MKDDKYHFPTARQVEIWAKLDAEAELVALWTYTNRDSIEAFRVFELQREEDGRKMQRMAWLVPPGYRVDEPPRPWPLYRMPELGRGGQIYVCQSEAAADRLREAGLLATTSAYGISGVGKSDWSPLAGREVVILPDNDDAGRMLARRVTARLVRQSPPAQVRVVALPGLGVHGTVGDFIDMRHPRQLSEIATEIAELAEMTPEHWQVRAQAPGGVSWASVPASLALSGPVAPRQWLWPGWLETGRLNLLLGAAGAGQSMMAADLAARITTGAPWPDGCAGGRRRSVVLLAERRHLDDVIRPALEPAGADLRRILTLPLANPAAGAWPAVAALERALNAEPEARLVVIDPYSVFFAGNSRAAVGALNDLAAGRRVAILMVGTLSRRALGLAGLRDAGGHALTAAGCASVVVHDRREAGRWMCVAVKSGAMAPEAQIKALACRANPGGALAWEPAAEARVREALIGDGEPRSPSVARVKRRAAGQWLRDRLARGLDGPARADAAAAGFSWITIRRARVDIGAICERCPQTGRFRWRLLETRD